MELNILGNFKENSNNILPIFKIDVIVLWEIEIG